jgi:hypothetical protein
MELEHFIRETLVAIKKGVRSANTELAEFEGGKLGIDQRAMFIFQPDEKDGSIKFDIAITVSSENKAKGEAGIKIAIAKLGADLSESSSLEHVSRIQFSLRPSLITG